jgi:hypothetical protein
MPDHPIIRSESMFDSELELENIDDYFLSEHKNDNIADLLCLADKSSRSARALKMKVEEILAKAEQDSPILSASHFDLKTINPFKASKDKRFGENTRDADGEEG